MLRCGYAEDRPASCVTGTKEVAEPLRFDPARVEAYMAGRRQACRAAQSPAVQGRQSNPTYLLETPARKYVLRPETSGKLLPSAHAVDREFASSRR